jgi:hypothetical protein
LNETLFSGSGEKMSTRSYPLSHELPVGPRHQSAQCLGDPLRVQTGRFRVVASFNAVETCEVLRFVQRGSLTVVNLRYISARQRQAPPVDDLCQSCNINSAVRCFRSGCGLPHLALEVRNLQRPRILG